MTTSKSDGKKKVTVKKTTLKDLKIGSRKEGDVKGGGGRYNVSQPKTPTDPGCTCC